MSGRANQLTKLANGNAHQNRLQKSFRAPRPLTGEVAGPPIDTTTKEKEPDLEANNQWLTLTTKESSLSPRPATSGSWPTSTRARPPRPSASCTTPASTTRWARSTRAAPRWTGCPRSKSGVSRSRRRLLPACGTTTASTSSTRRAMSTSPSRWSGRCASSTGRSQCSTPSPVSSLRPRPSGARPTSTACPVSVSSTKWTASGPTLPVAST